MISPQLAAPYRPLPRTTRAGLPEVAAAHLVGICGAGMRALAELLVGLGCRVTGSDLQRPSAAIQAMQRRGLRFHLGHNDDHLPRDVDVVVFSPAVEPGNPERQLAAELRIPQMSYSQMLGWLMRTRVGVSVAGTHGKSTTTAMAACVLEHAGLAPSAVFGAELCGIGKSGWAGGGELFVVESCEYQRSFLDLHPRFAVVTGVEPDHFDCYRTFDETKAAFADFAAQVEPGGVLMVRGDCEAAQEAAQRAAADVLTFSLQPGSDWWAADVRPTPTGTRFRTFFRGEYVAEISLSIPGRHNVANALAAAALCSHVGAMPAAIREALQEFRGIRRRFEYVGSWRGMTLIDDYAHHPTAVATTLRTARERFGGRRIWCVFQPHQVSRTTALMREFAASFADADEVLIAPIFAARESIGPSESTADELVRRIVDHGRKARFIPSLDRILATLDDEARPGDVLLLMGAGDIDRVHHEFARRLRRDHPVR